MREACTEFAALLWQEVLKNMGASLAKGLGAGGSFYLDFAWQTVARDIARTSGLDEMLFRGMSGPHREYNT